MSFFFSVFYVWYKIRGILVIYLAEKRNLKAKTTLTRNKITWISFSLSFLSFLQAKFIKIQFFKAKSFNMWTKKHFLIKQILSKHKLTLILWSMTDFKHF